MRVGLDFCQIPNQLLCLEVFSRQGTLVSPDCLSILYFIFILTLIRSLRPLLCLCLCLRSLLALFLFIFLLLFLLDWWQQTQQIFHLLSVEQINGE